MHLAGGEDACCCHALCVDKKCAPVLVHHFFECVKYKENRKYFRDMVRKLYSESDIKVSSGIQKGVIDNILVKPNEMWVGLIDVGLFELGLRLASIHEIHRIMVISSIMSWGRYYAIP